MKWSDAPGGPAHKTSSKAFVLIREAEQVADGRPVAQCFYYQLNRGIEAWNRNITKNSTNKPKVKSPKNNQTQFYTFNSLTECVLPQFIPMYCRHDTVHQCTWWFSIYQYRIDSIVSMSAVLVFFVFFLYHLQKAACFCATAPVNTQHCSNKDIRPVLVVRQVCQVTSN